MHCIFKKIFPQFLKFELNKSYHWTFFFWSIKSDKSIDKDPILFLPIKVLSKTSTLSIPEGILILNLKASYQVGFDVLFFILVSWVSSWNDKETNGLQLPIKLSFTKSFASITVIYNLDLSVNPFSRPSLFRETSSVNSSRAFSYFVLLILIFSSKSK